MDMATTTHKEPAMTTTNHTPTSVQVLDQAYKILEIRLGAWMIHNDGKTKTCVAHYGGRTVSITLRELSGCSDAYRAKVGTHRLDVLVMHGDNKVWGKDQWTGETQYKIADEVASFVIVDDYGHEEAGA
jgi:hypothetical protein